MRAEAYALPETVFINLWNAAQIRSFTNLPRYGSFTFLAIQY
jgi:hypothetical protein